MFTIYQAFVNAKRMIRQGFEINVWSHFAYVLYVRKTFVCSSRANLTLVISSLNNNSSIVKVSYRPMFFFTFSRSSLCNSLIISCLPFEIFCILQNICLILVVKESAYCCSGFPGFSLFPCLFIWCTRSITMFSAISSLSLMSD